MDEQTKQALSEFIRKALEATEKAGEFAVEQAPLVVQEYITRGIASAAFGAVAGLIVVAIAGWAFRKSRRLFDIDEGLGVCAYVFSTAGLIAGACITSANAYTALMIYVAPRVYIIEQLKGLL